VSSAERLQNRGGWSVGIESVQSVVDHDRHPVHGLEKLAVLDSIVTIVPLEGFGRPNDYPDRGIIPVQRSEVLAAQDDINELAAALRCAGPVAPRGVAIANLLLTDGTGPLYNPREGVNLRDQVRIAVHHLQPIQASRR